MENRKYPRFTVKQFIEISILKERFINVEGINISEGGLFCKCKEVVEPLSQVFVMLNFEMDDKIYSIKSDGVIVHSKVEDGICYFGVQFEDLSSGNREIINKYIKEYLT